MEVLPWLHPPARSGLTVVQLVTWRTLLYPRLTPGATAQLLKWLNGVIWWNEFIFALSFCRILMDSPYMEKSNQTNSAHGHATQTRTSRTKRVSSSSLSLKGPMTHSKRCNFGMCENTHWKSSQQPKHVTDVTWTMLLKLPLHMFPRDGVALRDQILIRDTAVEPAKTTMAKATWAGLANQPPVTYWSITVKV